MHEIFSAWITMYCYEAIAEIEKAIQKCKVEAGIETDFEEIETLVLTIRDYRKLIEDIKAFQNSVLERHYYDLPDLFNAIDCWLR